MQQSPSHIFTLPNGLRAVYRHSDGPASYIGLAVNAGSRDEDPARHGLAHFVEHTIFKGTSRRNSAWIANRMESVGGELNAYTSKEETVIYTASPAGDPARALALISELISDSAFPRQEIDREREVVIEEIHSYLDSPSDNVYDEFEERIFAGSGLAHNILGTPDSVRGLSGDDCRAFIDRWYTPSDVVLYVQDSTPLDRVQSLVARHFGHLRFPTAERNRTTPPPAPHFDHTLGGDNHQANTLMGTRLNGRHDPDRFALFLLNNILGGPCMNSRLNRELRDRRGLVYTVDSSVSLLSDTGLMLIYFACDPANTDRCRHLVETQIDRLAQSPLSQRAFQQAQRQYCGQLLLSADHRESRAMAMAKSVLYYGQVHTAQWQHDQIMALTPMQLCQAAQSLLANGPLSALTLR